ncbi:MAG: group 1 truncated hemoglobin [Dehalococcoidales bacterium]|nr:group 1 truncated hemoglobin [Dehalococcoidales bacterium]
MSKNPVRATMAAVLTFLGSSSAVASEPSAPGAEQRPLYDRLGGLVGITQVTDDFIDRLVTNKTLNANPAIDAGRKRSPAAYLKFQVSALICQVTGGPCKYTGKEMKVAHVHLNITEKEWGVMVAEFKKSLARFKVPATEQQELFDIVGKTKGDIVMPATAAK